MDVLSFSINFNESADKYFFFSSYFLYIINLLLYLLLCFKIVDIDSERYYVR